ncbi:hypothetical protein FDUTEX481_00160 [Tolypothrix sp. PCC 7601]|nr:hypothetical protein FDUTEX481_00160 [Tolypothrix sp. PCC 7601]
MQLKSRIAYSNSESKFALSLLDRLGAISQSNRDSGVTLRDANPKRNDL